MQTGWQRTGRGRDSLVSPSRRTRVRNNPPRDNARSTGAVDYCCHCDTHIFLYSFGGAPRSHIKVVFFFSFFFPFVPSLLSAVVCQWFIVSNCKTLCKDWTLGYISWEQGEVLQSTCHGAVCNTTPETQSGAELSKSHSQCWVHQAAILW